MRAVVTWHTGEDTELVIAYSGSTVVLGFKDSEQLLTVVMPTGFATHLLLELRESLKDLNTEGE